jgi:hypothetical protein
MRYVAYLSQSGVLWVWQNAASDFEFSVITEN